jgi:hypothetical protein
MKIKKYLKLLLVFGILAMFGGCSSDNETISVPKPFDQYKQDYTQFVTSELTKVQKCVMGYNKGDFKYSSDTTNYHNYKVAYQTALVAAQTVLAKTDLTISDIVNSDETLAVPGKNFNSSLLISDRRPLNDAIVAAQTLLSATPVGTASGQVSADAATAYTDAITAAKKVRDTSTTIDRQVTDAVTQLNAATTIFKASIIK